MKQQLKRLQREVYRSLSRGGLSGDLDQQLKELRSAYRITAAKRRARVRFFEGLPDYCKLVRSPRTSSVPSQPEGCPEHHSTAEFILNRLSPSFDSGHRLLWRIRQLGPEGAVPAVTVPELELVVARLKNGAPGEDKITNKTLKETFSELKGVWADTFTRLLNERRHPDEFKQRNGILLLKPNRDPGKANSWRPVVLQIATCNRV